MADVFVSYVRKDAVLVNRLVDALQSRGIEPWIDKRNLPKGKQYDVELEKALDAAPCAIACWTENCRTSRNMRDEIQRAADDDKLIPLLLENVKLPMGIGTLEYFDLTPWIKDPTATAELDKLATEIRSRARISTVRTSQQPSGFAVREGYGKDFDKRLNKAAEGLLQELAYIDSDFQFQSNWFTHLDAEVEVHTGASLDDRKIDVLLSSIENNKTSPMFLVLGDPGAGKSVAMRELARHGLGKVAKTKILPIYVNLREWLPEQKWSKDNPPTVHALEAFLNAHLSFQDNPALSEFLAEYLGRMHRDGRIFWIFDSFDEIPAVLDATLTETIVRPLSKVLERFIGQGSRGVISSRYHRRPQLPYDIATRLDVRPFGEDKINTALRKVTAFPVPLIASLLNTRPDLVPLARTPFYLGLIAEFGTRKKRLPHTQIELFEVYILSRLGSDALKIDDIANADLKTAVRVAEDIGHMLFTSKDYGLEAPIGVLADTFPDVDMPAIIERLVEARIMRKGRPPTFVCSFSHRRIQEYFVIRHMLRTGEPFDHEWVAIDSRMRDAAVLYVELASPAEAESIARRCWEEVAAIAPAAIDYGNPSFWRALHCQRFLAEAFRARLPALERFRAAMAGRVLSTLDTGKKVAEDAQRYASRSERVLFHAFAGGQDILTAKLAVETVGLLPDEKIPDVLAAALQNGDPWVRESAVNASRFLPKVRPDLAGRIWRSIAAMPEEEFEHEQTRLSYAFQLSSGLSEIGQLIRQRTRDIQHWYLFGFLIAGFFRIWHLTPVLILRELVLRGRQGVPAINPITTATGKALADLERDKTAGLEGYRRVLASTKRWQLGGMIALTVAAAVLGFEVFYQVNIYGRDYAFAAFVYAMQSWAFYLIPILVLTPGLWIAPYFARRSYPLILPDEDVPKRTWGQYLEGPRQWVGGGIMIVVGLAIGGGIWALIIWGGRALLQYLDSSGRMLDWASIGMGYFWIIYLGVAGITGAAFIVTTAITTVQPWLEERRRIAADRQRLKAIFEGADNSTRRLITESFQGFKTDEAREKYVRWLGEQRMTPEGDWPGGRPPNLGDTASSLLARLEHRWRGLDT